jgi:hypothetical protein
MGPQHSSTVDKHDYNLCANVSTCIDDSYTPVLGSLLYLYLHFQDVKIAALLDSGSTTNLMSVSLYNRLPKSVKSELKELSFDKLELANGSCITMLGTARVKVYVPRLHKCMHVVFHVLEQTSQPVILGTQFLALSGISLDFSDPGKCSDVVYHKNYKVVSRTTIVLSPESEAVVFGSISDSRVYPGVHGMCSQHHSFAKSNVVSCKCIGVVDIDNTIPIKLLNATDTSIVINRGTKIATFTPFDHSCSVIPFEKSVPLPKVCNYVNISPISACDSDTDGGSRAQFLSEFNLENPNLTTCEKKSLSDILYANRDVFVTESSPALGKTSLVEHTIHLKENFVPKLQRPFRLAPDKKQILRHQLDELLKQGIISPVSEKADLPITSPVVLVRKRNKKRTRLFTWFS